MISIEHTVSKCVFSLKFCLAILKNIFKKNPSKLFNTQNEMTLFIGCCCVRLKRRETKLDCSIQIGHCLNTEFKSKNNLTTYFNYSLGIR